MKRLTPEQYERRVRFVMWCIAIVGTFLMYLRG